MAFDFHIRAVAAGPVCPVSTRPPLLRAHSCLAWYVRTRPPKHTGDLLKLARWQTVRKTLFQQLAVLPGERLVSQALSAKDVACKTVSERSESRNHADQYCTMQWAERVDIHTCKISSSLQETSYWAKNSPRSNLIASGFPPKFLGSIPPGPLAVAFCAGTTNLTASILMATALLSQ